jgi:oxalate---CoA ligase
VTSEVRRLVEDAAVQHRDRLALLAPGRDAVTHARLLALLNETERQLRALHVRPGDPVATVLPNGPDLAMAFLALSAACACAPLDPGLTRPDFERRLEGLGARALLVGDAAPAAAVDAARRVGVPILRIRPRREAGAFDLEGASVPARGDPIADDAALLLYTSGTSATPKLVPLSGRNLAASARHIAQALELGPDDRCLNVMPLFHVHGLLAGVLASIAAGASVVCTSGLPSAHFFSWTGEFEPSWYTAVPAMHQDILARAAAHRDDLRRVRLRFVRSSSAPLAAAVLSALERAFDAPVVEAYGMTEAAHQITSNPVDTARRRVGSVGVAAGPEIAILAPSGERLPPGARGEVVVRGPNVTVGYRGGDPANAGTRVGDWLRTGDEGALDADGYLWLTGRLKDVINRGGEKVSPREVDDVLLAHAAVRQAVCFAMPHAQLGEDVGAAVELAPGARVDESELRAWARARLPAFKVPRVIRIVEALPAGATGKLVRAEVAARVASARHIEGNIVPPRTATEADVAAVWRRLFPGRSIGVTTPFDALGGDSLLAVAMLAEVGERVGFDVPHGRFVDDGTIEALAADIDAARSGDHSPLVPLQAHGSRPPLYCVPGHDGLLFGLARLARTLDPEQPVWAIDLRRVGRYATVEDLAARCADVLLAHETHGPYRLAGVCFGGVVAAALAHRLEAGGQRVAFVALLDSLNPAWHRDLARVSRGRARLDQLREKVAYHAGHIRAMDARARARYVAGRAVDFARYHGESAAALLGLSFARAHNRRIAVRHVPAPVAARAVVVRVRGRRPHVAALGWTGTFRGGVRTVDVPFEPHGALSRGSVGHVGAALRAADCDAP